MQRTDIPAKANSVIMSDTIPNTVPEIIPTGVISFVNGDTYDPLYKKYPAPGRTLIQSTVHEIEAIYRALIVDTHSREICKNAIDIRQLIDKVGYENITVNFECCSGFTAQHNQKNCFVSPEYSNNTNIFIAYMLSKGSQVVCADFALKALIGSWDNKVFGAECPLIQTGETSGSVHAKFDIETCKSSVFPQICAIANLATPDDASIPGISSIKMFALSGTITYDVKDHIDPNINVKILSVTAPQSSMEGITGIMDVVSSVTSIVPQFQPTVSGLQSKITSYVSSTIKTIGNIISNRVVRNSSVDTDDPSQQSSALPSELPSNPKITKINYGSVDTLKLQIHNQAQDQKQEEPIHAEIRFKHLSGVLIVSSLHLINLIDVSTTNDNIYSSAMQSVGPEIASQMQSQLETATANGPDALRIAQSECVRQVAAYSSMGSKRK
jgi:hypothetical protein